jgi:hypothetical protein
MTDERLAKARWMSIHEAAAILSVPVLTLRRAIERNARRGPAGSVEASIDGVHARKFGRRWRVWLDPTWIVPAKAVQRAG